MAESAEKALHPLVEALEVDGYTARITDVPGLVTFEIEAGPGACEECLSPPSVLEPMIQHALRSAGVNARLDLKYPPQH